MARLSCRHSLVSGAPQSGFSEKSKKIYATFPGDPRIVLICDSPRRAGRPSPIGMSSTESEWPVRMPVTQKHRERTQPPRRHPCNAHAKMRRTNSVAEEVSSTIHSKMRERTQFPVDNYAHRMRNRANEPNFLWTVIHIACENARTNPDARTTGARNASNEPRCQNGSLLSLLMRRTRIVNNR
jgi:hypothetical protein